MPHGWRENGSPAVLPWQSYDNAAAAGGLVASAADMANWLTLHLNEGSFKGRQILTKDTVRELHALHNCRSDQLGEKPPFSEEPEGYAMGWSRGRYRGKLHLAHAGGMLGFPAYAAFIPKDEIGIVVLSNGPRSANDQVAFNRAVAFWLFDRALDEPMRDWSRECLAWLQRIRLTAEHQEMELRRGRRLDANPSLALDQYAGIYEDRTGRSGPVRVSVENGELRLSFPGSGAFSAVLEHWHFDLFRMHASPVIDEVFDRINLQRRFVGFSLSPKGRIGSMTALGIPFVRQGG